MESNKGVHSLYLIDSRFQSFVQHQRAKKAPKQHKAYSRFTSRHLPARRESPASLPERTHRLFTRQTEWPVLTL